MKRKIILFCIFLVFALRPAVGWAVQPYAPLPSDPMQSSWLWHTFPELKNVQAMAEDHGGNMWFGLADKVRFYDGVHWRAYDKEQGLFPGLVQALCVDSKGAVYAGTQTGISRFENGTWHRFFPAQGDLPWPVFDLLEASDGSLWAATGWGTLRIDQESTTLFTSSDVATVLQELSPKLQTVVVPDAIVPTRSWGQSLGIAIQPYSESVSVPVVVWNLAKDGPGIKAGLRRGDRIVAVNGKTTYQSQILIGSTGRPVRATVKRPGRSDMFEVEIIPGGKMEETPRNFRVYSLCEDLAGGMWMGMSDGEVFHFNPKAEPGDAWRRYGRAEGLGIGFSPYLEQTRDGTLWYVSQQTNRNASRFDGKKWSSLSLRALGGTEINHSILELRDGTLWIGGAGTLHVYKGEKWQIYSSSIDIPIPEFRILKILETASGAIWMTSRGQTVRIDRQTPRLQMYRGLLFGGQTSDGTKWFISQDQRVVQYDGRHWKSYGTEDGLMNTPTALRVVRNDEVWVSGSQDQTAAVAAFNGHKWDMTQYPQLSWGIASFGFFEDNDDGIWFCASGRVISGQGHQGGLIRLDRSGRQDHFTDRGFPSFVREIAQTPDGAIWIAGSRGLFRLVDNQLSRITEPDVFNRGTSDAVSVDASGRLWIGHRSQGMFLYQNGVWNQHLEPTEFGGRIWSIVEVSADNIWVASSQCLWHYDGRNWTAKDYPMPIPAGQRAALMAEDGRLWINIFNGRWFSRADPRFTDSRHEVYDLLSIQYQADTEAPETEITVFSKTVSQPGNTALSWQGADPWRVTSIDQLEFAWRLDGGPWSSFSPRLTHSFQLLTSGDHVFEVKARDGDFNEDPTPAVVHFTVVPPIWQEVWFICLIGSLLLLVVFQTVRVFKRGQGLRHANLALQQANDDLEQRVLARTSELAWSNQKLSISNRELQDVAKVAAHDLQEPVRKIQVFADLIKEEATDTSNGTKPYLDHLIDATLQVQDRTRDFAAFSNLTIQDTQFAQVDLNRIVEAVRDKTQGRFEEIGGQIEVGNLPTLEADQEQMSLLFYNLIENSLKYHKEDVPLRISIESQCVERDTEIIYQIAVHDNGIGFEAQYAQRIFEVFQRLHDQTAFSGTGMGLAQCRKIAMLHQGMIVAESVLGEGATFTITLPLRQKEDE